jgi:hypothetical protein
MNYGGVWNICSITGGNRERRSVMGKSGFVLCVCQGTCPSFKKMDIFNVLADVHLTDDGHEELARIPDIFSAAVEIRLFLFREASFRATGW